MSTQFDSLKSIFRREYFMRRLAIAVIFVGIILLNGCQNSTDEIQTLTIEEQKDTIGTNLPQISITKDFINWFAEDNSTLLFEQTYCTVEVTNDGFDNLADALLNWSKEHALTLDDSFSIEFILQCAKEDFLRYFSYQYVQIGRSDAHIVSLIEDFSEDYTIGGDVNFGRRGYTFDVQSGKNLALEDLLIDKEGFYAKATDYISDKLYEDHSEQLFSDYKQTITKILTNEYGVNYYLDAAGIVIVYNPWEVGVYALKETYMTLPYAMVRNFQISCL
ncbi:MAG: RsiV family protein [Lachnospiraceae bacterium]|nr:RsiV family protein [Lachnospiraceae bacterium]